MTDALLVILLQVLGVPRMGKCSVVQLLEVVGTSAVDCVRFFPCGP
jgi:hypothetical protein